VGSSFFRKAPRSADFGDSPNEFPKPSRIAGALRNDVKPWWDEWDWSFKATTTILGIIVVLGTIIAAVCRMMR
jgi:preprotein translocase subunit Sss1